MAPFDGVIKTVDAILDPVVPAIVIENVRHVHVRPGPGPQVGKINRMVLIAMIEIPLVVIPVRGKVDPWMRGALVLVVGFEEKLIGSGLAVGPHQLSVPVAAQRPNFVLTSRTGEAGGRLIFPTGGGRRISGTLTAHNFGVTRD